VRILVNYMHRGGWVVHCLAEDAQTGISPMLQIAEESTLLRLLRASGTTDEEMEEIERDMRQMARGSTWINVSDQGRKLLRLVL
jgi:hypothetical protein